eukprot:974335-Karenia_brevis.AAC.1
MAVCRMMPAICACAPCCHQGFWCDIAYHTCHRERLCALQAVGGTTESSGASPCKTISFVTAMA